MGCAAQRGFFYGDQRREEVRMSIRYESLDHGVRENMLTEFEQDRLDGSLYLGSRLTVEGQRLWPALLREALERRDDSWLANSLRYGGMLETHERRARTGWVAVPVTAADTLAEGEFNRFYLRGLCLHVLAAGGTEVEVYRGKQVVNPRAESNALIGRRLPAGQLLNSLRTGKGVEPALGLPPGANSGLTARRVQR